MIKYLARPRVCLTGQIEVDGKHPVSSTKIAAIFISSPEAVPGWSSWINPENSVRQKSGSRPYLQRPSLQLPVSRGPRIPGQAIPRSQGADRNPLPWMRKCQDRLMHGDTVGSVSPWSLVFSFFSGRSVLRFLLPLRCRGQEDGGVGLC